MPVGNLKSWRCLADPHHFTKPVCNACLWMDLFDLKKEGKNKISKKSTKWSYKCNAPGLRFMVLEDARGRIQKLWGGYSPKVFDGDFLKIQQEWLDKKLKGAVVLADQHFEWGKKQLKKVRFITPIKRKKGNKKTGVGLSTLTKEEAELNTAIHSARARVEGGIGRMVEIFKV